MAPKPKITKEMIVEAGFDLVKESGIASLNARSLSKKLHCSTQPILYYFATMDDLKKAVYTYTDEFHSQYLMNIQEDPMLAIGLNYIRFAVNEKYLFQFLFQTNEFSGNNLIGLIDAEEIQPVIHILSETSRISMNQAKILFRILFLEVHGYASMYANNEMTYDETVVIKGLELLFDGLTTGGLNHEKVISEQ